jgi:hypothetical protein
MIKRVIIVVCNGCGKESNTALGWLNYTQPTINYCPECVAKSEHTRKKREAKEYYQKTCDQLVEDSGGAIRLEDL